MQLAKRRGFLFPGSQIYGGLANSWDFGPLGTELKNNLRDSWWKNFVHKRTDMVGLDAAIMMNPKVWENSGHLENFNDALIDCKECKSRFRADHLIEEVVDDINVEGLEPEELSKLITKHEIKCPECQKQNFTDVRTFNLLFETSIGKTEASKTSVYLRGEIAQAMFVNFKNVITSTRRRLPFGIASVGKAFRNEITPGNATFRTLEFDLMELEYFVKQNDAPSMFEYWLTEMQSWLDEIGFSKDNLRVREHTADELSHYSDRTVDIEYQTPFGWKEMFGLANRTDFDLKKHMEGSGEDLQYTDPETNEKFLPYAIEPTFGLSRMFLLLLLEAYTEEEAPSAKEDEKSESRIVMKLHPRLAPFKVAILPLSKKPELSKIARPLQEVLAKRWYTEYDETQSIGKRYRRQDEIGTPYCITVDFESIEDKAVTVRDRDTMAQDRVKIDELEDYLANKLGF